MKLFTTKPSKKMPPERVRQLRERYDSGALLKELSNEFNISISYAQLIGLRLARKNVE